MSKVKIYSSVDQTIMKLTNPDSLAITEYEEFFLSTILGNKEGLYGLEIISAIKNTSQGKKRVDGGSLYPTLRRLQENNFIEFTTGTKKNGARQYYRITQKGIDAINEKQQFRQRLINWKSPNN
jgi:DNA-binding PadR family transcriptional regulator